MDYSKKLCSVTRLAFIIFLFLTTLIIIILLLMCSWEPLANNPFFLLNRKTHPDSNVTANNSSFVMKDELQMALEKASMGNKEKTLIITVINKAYVESGDEFPAMFDLFLEGFWAGEGTRPLLGQLLVVSMDQAAHERCEFRRLNCYSLTTGGTGGDKFAGEKVYMSGGFIEMMWRRTAFLLDVLNRGFSFIFTDTDVLWLRNPFTKLSSNETLDLQISTDEFNGNPTSIHNPINTGFYFVRSNEKTISLFQTWYDARNNATGWKEQDVLEKLVRDGVLGKLGFNVEFLDTQYFSGFCKDSRDVKQVATVHANCCRSIVAKVADLKMVLKDWNMFKIGGNASDDHSQNGTNIFQWSTHASCLDSWTNIIKTS